MPQLAMKDRPVSQVALDYVIERKRLGVMRPATARAQRYTLSAFAECNGNPPVSKLSRRHVIKFLSHGNVSQSTRRNHYSTVKTFVKWLRERHLLDNDPMLTITSPKEPRRLPRGLTRDQVAAVLNIAPDARARLILLLGVQEGLRRGEIAAIDLADVDLYDRVLLVHGKGGHERLLPLSDETTDALRAYLAEYPATVGPLIRSYIHPDRGMNAGTIGELVRRWLRDAGVKVAAWDGKSAHSLRHTMAGDLLRNGAHVRDVQAALGHANLQTTQIYMPLVVGDLRDAMAGRTYQESRTGLPTPTGRGR